jgi:hypothetical protein
VLLLLLLSLPLLLLQLLLASTSNAGGELHSVTVQRGGGAGGSYSFIGAMPVKKAVMLLWRCGMQC